MAAGHQGYLLLSVAGYNIETSATTAGVLLALAFIVLLLLEWLISRLFSCRSRLRNWFIRRRKQKAVDNTMSGMLAMTEGNYRKAEKLIVRGAREHHTPLLNYLSAAEAAQGQSKPEQRDNYLRLAYEHEPKAELAIGIVQARLQLQSKQFEEALATLRQLYRSQPRNVEVLGLLRQVYLKLGEWQDLLDLLPNLQKQKVCSESECHKLLRVAIQGLFEQLAKDKDPAPLINSWRSLSKAERLDPVILAALCRQLMLLNADQQAFEFLKEGLKLSLDPQLLALFGRLKLNDLQVAERYLDKLIESQPSQAALYRAKGSIQLQLGLPDKAAQSYEKLVSLKDVTAEDYLKLASLSEQARLPDKAAGYYRKGLNLAIASNP